ncbi:MAG: hypothetical protein QXR57_05450 [Metallosphaera sp.]|uniref:hypothetical protein n=1 Tax=Metallosphaera sp. TaxID=2020860 RepID=UPI0031607B3D
MIIKPKLEWHETTSLKAPYIYWRDTLIVLYNPTKVFVVDAFREQLSKYAPPPQVSIFKYTYRIGQVDDENVKFLECIAGALQTRLKPLITRKYACKDILVEL